MCVCEYTYVCEMNIGVLYASILNHLGMHACMYISTEPYTDRKLDKFIHYDIDFNFIFPCPSKKILILKTS